MRCKFILYFVLGILIISYASAINTEINVKTMGNVKVSILVLDPAQVYYLLNSFHIQSGNSGEVSAIYSGAEDSINIRVQVTDNGEQLLLEKFESVKTGKPVYITAFIGNVSISDKKEAEINVSSQNSSGESNISANVSVNSSETEASNKISGNAILDDISFPVKWYYIIGGVVLIFAAGFLIFRFFINRNSIDMQSYNYKKLDSNNLGNTKKLVGELSEAQKKIAALQSELNMLKSKEKIKEVEKKIQADKEELERLRKGL